jgi:membrane protease subunit (stomatin/prohibitin family)
MVGGAGYMAGKHAANTAAREQDQSQQIADLQAQQQAQYAAAPPPPPPPAPPAPPAAAPAAAGGDLASQFGQLKSLMDQGVLTQEEFDAAKQKLISG